MFPISPFTPPPSAGGESHRPASRMDVQRHRLEDTRASYLQLQVAARGERKNRLAAPLRSLRVFVANMLIAAGERLRHVPGATPELVSAGDTL